MKKLKRSFLPLASLTFGFVLIMSLAVYAVIAENESGQTIDILRYETVTTNNGTINEIGSNGFVTDNYGTVGDINAGNVGNNYGTVNKISNTGSLGVNCTGGTVTTNNRATIESNYGTVTTNIGTINRNYAQVDENYGTITMHDGNVGVNENEIIFEKTSTEVPAKGTVTTNKSKIIVNSGTLDNPVTITNNNEGSTITVNGGVCRVISNSGKIVLGENANLICETNNETGFISKEKGITADYSCSTNNGTIAVDLIAINVVGDEGNLEITLCEATLDNVHYTKAGENVVFTLPSDFGCEDSFTMQSFPNDIFITVPQDYSENVFTITCHKHNYEVDSKTQSDHTLKCTVCANTLTNEHTFGSYTSNGDATYESDGTKSRFCEACNYEDKVADPGSKLTHSSGGSSRRKKDNKEEEAEKVIEDKKDEAPIVKGEEKAKEENKTNETIKQEKTLEQKPTIKNSETNKTSSIKQVEVKEEKKTTEVEIKDEEKLSEEKLAEENVEDKLLDEDENEKDTDIVQEEKSNSSLPIILVTVLVGCIAGAFTVGMLNKKK